MAVVVQNYKIGKGNPLCVMSGPCVIESRTHCLEVAHELKEMFEELGIPLIFKSSFDKANRSSSSSFRGPGLEAGLAILKEVKDRYGLPIISDIHCPEQVDAASEVCDILQIPAFLCRQTDLILKAANSQKVLSVKKGQFMSPWEMGNVVDKIRSTGNNQIILTDRGTSFGYQNLVSDMRAIPVMKDFGAVVCFDASHSVQLPGGMGHQSGGQREFIEPLASAAIAAGADCIFIESHPDPKNAKSDAATVFPFAKLPSLMKKLKKLYAVINENNE
jgi:2-dehydro-3-deoxyphosphooctonate aldolase (KDO 8-P synthase)